eukprot:352578-Chlamydomonas_euryale.AAC.4
MVLGAAAVEANAAASSSSGSAAAAAAAASAAAAWMALPPRRRRRCRVGGPCGPASRLPRHAFGSAALAPPPPPPPYARAPVCIAERNAARYAAAVCAVGGQKRGGRGSVSQKYAQGDGGRGAPRRVTPSQAVSAAAPTCAGPSPRAVLRKATPKTIWEGGPKCPAVRKPIGDSGGAARRCRWRSPWASSGAARPTGIAPRLAAPPHRSTSHGSHDPPPGSATRFAWLAGRPPRPSARKARSGAGV